MLQPARTMVGLNCVENKLLNRNNLKMRKLNDYLLRNAQRSEFKVGSISEAFGHTPVIKTIL